MSPAALQIDNRAARLLWLGAQGLARAPVGRLDLRQTIRDLGFVQLDTIQVVSRAHHHILWSRNTNYREPMLDKMLGQDRSVFEHFTHDASVLPMEFLAMWQRQFRRKRAEMDRPGYYRARPERGFCETLLNRIRAEGALSTKAFDTRIEGPREMWARPPHKLALDYLWFGGELGTSHRQNFTKFYDLPDRVFPHDPREERMSDADQIDWLNRAALDRMGFGAPGDIQRYWDAVSSTEVRQWVSQVGTDLVPVEVECANGDWFSALAPGDIEARLAALTPATSRLRILNPFDPVIRDRTRLSRLFGFDYRVEMFVPAAKRIWGYYVFPIIEGHRMVGRIEIKADRKAGTLNVLNFWPEPGVAWGHARHAKLEQELDRMRRFVGLEAIHRLD